jgi:hypothetical protein
MESIPSEHLNRRSGSLRDALEISDEVELTYRGSPFALVFTHARVARDREELHTLRAEVARLRNLLDAAAGRDSSRQSLASVMTG